MVNTCRGVDEIEEGGRKREDLAKIRSPKAEMSLTDIMKDLD